MLRIGAILIAVCILATPLREALAHGGAMDSDGCHHDTATGVYHCHRGDAGAAAAEEDWVQKVQQMQPGDAWCPPVMAHLLPHFVELLSKEAEKKNEMRHWIVSLVAGIAMMDNSNHVKQAFLAMGCALLLPSLKQALNSEPGKRASKRSRGIDPKWLEDLLKDVPGLD